MEKTIENYTAEIRDFVVNNFPMSDGMALKDDASFMESDILDSTGILELVMFLENTYQIKTSDGEMVPENLDSVNRVAAFVARKRVAKSTSQT